MGRWSRRGLIRVGEVVEAEVAVGGEAVHAMECEVLVELPEAEEAFER